MEKDKTKIVFMGTPDFAVGILQNLFANKFNIVGVVTVPDKKSGRGLMVNTSAVKKYLLEKEEYQDGKIKLMQPTLLKDPEFLEELESLKADLFIVVAFRMLPKIVWSMPRLGTFNLHGSLLPKYRGAAPINWAIINGETETGVTTFMLDEKIDTGAILFYEKCPIGEKDNMEIVHDKLMEIGADLVVKTANKIISGDISPLAQKDTPNMLIPAPKLTRETGKINWNNNAIQIDRLIRGLSPYPGAHSIISNKGKETQVKIYTASISNNKHNGEIGKIETDSKNYLSVNCGDGTKIDIEELQVAGKKRLKIKEFLAGLHQTSDLKFVNEE